MRAATAAAEPAEDPPGVWPAFHGFFVGAGSRYANWVVWVLPRTMAPAARASSMHAASRVGRLCANVPAPARVGMPATWKMSFTPIGTPWSGPRRRAPFASLSSCRAAVSAPGASTCTHAWSRPSTAPIRRAAPSPS